MCDHSLQQCDGARCDDSLSAASRFLGILPRLLLLLTFLPTFLPHSQIRSDARHQSLTCDRTACSLAQGASVSVNTARQEALVRASDSVADSHCRLFPAALLCSVFTHLTLFTAVFLTFIYVFNCQFSRKQFAIAARTARC